MVITRDLWPEQYSDFWEIKYEEYVVNVLWTQNPFQDYMKLATCFFNCGCYILDDIIASGDDNTKSDMWFLPGVFMMRQSLELGLKALICRVYRKKSDIQAIFESCCHDLKKLYICYFNLTEKHLTEDEEQWLDKYLASIELIDARSDLFRFPFSNKFLEQYRNEFLDVVSVANNLFQAFLLIKKCLENGISKPEDKFDCGLSPEFLVLASNGIGNCYLWQPLSDDGFHAQITGYLDVSDFVFSFNKMSCADKVYPLMFLLRNGLELCLKRLFYSRVDNGVPAHIFHAKKKSHRIKKDLWKNVRPIIEHYAKAQGQDLSIIDIVEKKLHQIDSLDKNGDIFRYPTSYSLEYRINNVTIDIKNSFEYMRALLNFLDGCDSMLDAIADFESDMRDYYEW